MILASAIFVSSLSFYFLSEKAILPFLWIRKKIMEIYHARVNEPNVSLKDFLISFKYFHTTN